MGWIGEHVHDHDLREAYAAVEDLATWSDWLAFDEAVPWAPREPGVYLFRDPATHLLVHAGMAGERAASGRPQGLYGRLSAYRSGSVAVGGFGEAALDRALADADWLEEQVRRLRADGPRRARRWAADAVARLAPEVSWAVRPERADAQHLEAEVLGVLRPLGSWGG